MDSSKIPEVPFEHVVLKAKVAQICDHVGYHAMTKDSSNILVDIYRRLILSLGKHCKDAANNNRRVEPTLEDLVQAFDSVGISIPGLQEHVETVKIPLNIEVSKDDEKPPNRIQRNLLVDDLLDHEKNSQQEDHEDGENKDLSESGNDEEEKPIVPLLKDTYHEIASRFNNCQPVEADKKIRLGGRIILVANTKEKDKNKIKEKEKNEIKEKEKEKSKGKCKGKARGSKKETTKKSKISKIAIAPIEPPPQVEPSAFFPVLEPKVDEPDVDEIVPPPPVDPMPPPDIKIEFTSPITKQTKGKKRKKSSVESDNLTIDEEPLLEGNADKKIKLGKIVFVNNPKEKSKSKVKAPKEKSKDKDKDKTKDKGKARGSSKKESTKKTKITVTPLDPAIAEPPSFFPILETKLEIPDVGSELIPPQQQPLPTPPVTIHPIPEPSIASTSSAVKQTKVKKKKKSSSNQFAIVTETVTRTEDKEWFCPACGGPDDGDCMVQCDTCQEWYHLGCTSLVKPPEDDENWECDICINKAKALQKKPRTPVIVEPVIKLRTPEPLINTPPPPPSVPAASAVVIDPDACPECNQLDDGTLMIQCDDPQCARWFHGKCVNLLEEPKDDESWFCKACVEKQQSAFKRRRRAK